MRIVKLFVLATFLFTATAYSYQNTSSTVRVPLMTKRTSLMNGTGDGDARLKEATEAVAEKTPGLMDRVKALFLSNWKKLVYAKFTGQYFEHKFGNPEEQYGELVIVSSRDAALQLLKPLVKTLSRNHSNLKDEISAIVGAANNIDELKLVIDIRNIYLAKNIDSAETMRAIAKIEGTTQDRQEVYEALISLNRESRRNGLYVDYMLRTAIPAVLEAAKNIEELKLILSFGIELASETGTEEGENKREVGNTLFGISRVARIAKDWAVCTTMASLNKTIFLNISMETGGKARDINIAIAETVGTIEELLQVKDVVMPQIIEAAKDLRALKFINAGHFKTAIEEQKSGGFVIAIDYKPADTKRNGTSFGQSEEGNGSKETCKITISPFPTWAAKQGEKLASNTGLSVSFDKLDHAVIMAQAGIMSPESFVEAIQNLLGNKIENIFVVAAQENEIQELKDKIGEAAFKDMVQKGVKFTVPEKSALAALTAEIGIYEKNIFFAQDISVFKLTNPAVIKQLESGV